MRGTAENGSVGGRQRRNFLPCKLVSVDDAPAVLQANLVALKDQKMRFHQSFAPVLLVLPLALPAASQTTGSGTGTPASQSSTAA
ncbi:MAG: hypothetical protein WCA37_13560, partial [Terracidiphilus sp.]